MRGSKAVSFGDYLRVDEALIWLTHSRTLTPA